MPWTLSGWMSRSCCSRCTAPPLQAVQVQGHLPERWQAELGVAWMQGVGLQSTSSHHSEEYRETGRPAALWLTLLSPLPPSTLSSLGSLLSPATPGPATCYYWGSSHYKMFDGTVLSLHRPGCRQTLVTDPLANSIRVEAESDLQDNLILHLLLEADHYRVEVVGGRPTVTIGGRTLAVPGVHQGVTMQLAGLWLVLEVQGLGITLVWDTKDFLMITADGPLWDHTAGLCGSLNGNPYNDFAMGDGSSSHGVGAWVESWTSATTQPGPDGRPGSNMCEGGTPEHPCTPGSEEGERATQFCRSLLDR